MQAPTAKRVRSVRTLHGHETVDYYAWLREKDSPEVLAYLEAENQYSAEMTLHLESLREALFAETRSRIQETDRSAPARRGNYWYATRTEEGLDHPRYVRMLGSPDAAEEEVLDVNLLAHGYVRLGNFSVSEDQTKLAYSIDTNGSELFELRVRDLTTGADLPDTVPDTYYTAAWSSCGRYLFYTVVDDAHRPYRVFRHELGSTDDELVLEESDERFALSLSKSQDRRFILATLESHTTSEIRFIDADEPLGSFAPIRERRHGVTYSADRHRDSWLVVTDEDAPDGRLVAIGPDQETELVPHVGGRKLGRVVALADHIVIEGRVDGLSVVFILTESRSLRALEFAEQVHTVSLGPNYESETTTLRVRYESLVTPPVDIDIDLETDRRETVKEMPVLGGYDATEYRTWRSWSTATDGTRIPISLVARATEHPGPVLLYGYGSYEHPIDPSFSASRISLLDRGVTFAIAHVRGGGEMGKAWHEGGKMASKVNTFTDFVTCARSLIAEGVTSPDLLAARGRSAGGLLMGAAANLAPELFTAVVAEVPFVDVLNTMLDSTLPLTVGEWEEWGNPAKPDEYLWLAQYTPYENVRDVEYPAMLFTAGYNDPRVAYWEPAKLVARLRTEVRTRGPLLLKTEMGAGHSGPSGRYQAWEEEAFVMAWLLDRWGLVNG